MHFIKLSSENGRIYILQCSSSPYLDGESNELFQSFIHLYTYTHMPYHMRFFRLPTFTIDYNDHAIRDLSMYVYLYVMCIEKSRRRQVSHAVYLLEGIRSLHLDKHIYIYICTYMHPDVMVY